MNEKMPFNFYFFRFLTLVILITLFFIVPPKSVSFDNLANFSRVLLMGVLIALAHRLWYYYKRDPSEPIIVICKSCETSQYEKDLIQGQCAKCGGVVVSIEGYYDHNPKKRQQD